MIILSHRTKNRREFLLRAAICALASLLNGLSLAADAASGPQGGAVQVFTGADESSPIIEAVTDGRSLMPVAEMTGAGGVKWFMVKTKNGNVGWIRAGDAIVGTKIDEHFRALPKDSVSIGPASNAESTSPIAANGAVTIPVKIYGRTIIVPVSFKNGNSTVTAYLALDTGAGQTMVSRRVARDLRLLSIDSQRSIGIGGAVVTDVGVVDVVRVGQAAMKNMRVSIHDPVVNLGYDGLLGFDFLGAFQMSVDSDKQLLVLTPRKK